MKSGLFYQSYSDKLRYQNEVFLAGDFMSAGNGMLEKEVK